MSRPRGPRRRDTAEDRAAIKEFAREVWSTSIQLSQRVPFSAEHYWPLSSVTEGAHKVLVSLGADPSPAHSIKCGVSLPKPQGGDGDR